MADPSPYEWAGSLRWRDVPATAQRRTVQAVLDTLACAVAGTRTHAAVVTRAWAAACFGAGSHTVVGRPERLSAAGAVTANAFAANAFDLDDGHRPLKGHPGAIVVPVALTAAEQAGCRGRDLLAGVLVGYEIGLRAGLLLRHEYAHYHGTGAWGPVGAAAAAGRLHGLDPATMATALSLAEFHAPLTPVMRVVDHPTMPKDGIGWGAFAGHAAVDLARAGLTAPPSLFTHRAREAADLPALGDRFLLEDVYVKPWATCRWAQPAVAAVLAAQALLAPGAEVVEVRLATFEAATHLDRVAPTTTEEAQFSIPWAVACALVDGDVGPDQVGESELGDPARLNQAGHVVLTIDPVLDRQFPARALARAELVTTAGARVRSAVTAAPGEPREDEADDDRDATVARKARRLCTAVLGADGAEALVSAVHGLPDAPDARALLASVRPGRAAG